MYLLTFQGQDLVCRAPCVIDSRSRSLDYLLTMQSRRILRVAAIVCLSMLLVAELLVAYFQGMPELLLQVVGFLARREYMRPALPEAIPDDVSVLNRDSGLLLSLLVLFDLTLAA